MKLLTIYKALQEADRRAGENYHLYLEQGDRISVNSWGQMRTPEYYMRRCHKYSDMANHLRKRFLSQLARIEEV